MSMIKIYTTNPNPKLLIGNLWFIGLLIINITIIIFMYTFYKYKSLTEGKIGPSGDKGFAGYDGNDCTITIPNSNSFVSYSKI